MARAGDPSGLSGDPKGAAGIPKARNPHVFLDISVDGEGAERMVFELFSDVVPKTAENFRSLCTGERGSGAIIKKPLHYKGTKIHRIVQGFMAQGGDFWDGDGCGGESVYGGKFPDENFRLKHDGPGVLSMANSGVHSNGSQFFVTFNAAHGLDGKHVVFGRVVSGWALLNKLEAVGSQNGRPSSEVKIVDCGEISDPNVLNKLDKLKEEAVDRTSAKRKDECHGSSSSQKRYRRYGENDGYDEHPMSRRHHHGDSQRSPSKRHHHHNSQKSPNPSSRSSPSRRHHNHR